MCLIQIKNVQTEKPKPRHHWHQHLTLVYTAMNTLRVIKPCYCFRLHWKK